jgi:hypothetical protein
MRTQLFPLTVLALSAGCLGPDLDDYCGDPSEAAAAWEDGYENSAGETHDGLLGLWQGTAELDGTTETMSLVVNAATDEPILRSYPDAGEGYDNVQVSDACLDSYRFAMPAQLILDERGLDLSFELELSESGFSAGWTTSTEIAIPDCAAEPCALVLSFERYQPDSDTITGKLRWEDTTAEGDDSAPIDDANVSLTRVTE